MSSNSTNKPSARATRRPAGNKAAAKPLPGGKKPVARKKALAGEKLVARKKPAAKKMAERARITARVPAQVRDQLERAAEIMGAANVGQFIIHAAVSEAKRIIQSETVIELSARNFHAFAAALQQPPPDSEALEAALKKLTQARRRDDHTDRFDWQPRPRRV